MGPLTGVIAPGLAIQRQNIHNQLGQMDITVSVVNSVLKASSLHFRETWGAPQCYLGYKMEDGHVDMFLNQILVTELDPSSKHLKQLINSKNLYTKEGLESFVCRHWRIFFNM